MRHIYILWGLLALLAAATVFAVIQVENVQHHQNDALRSIMCHAEHVVKTQPGIPAKQRREALKFYRTSIAEAHLGPCP